MKLLGWCYQEPTIILSPMEERVLRLLVGNTSLSLYEISRALYKISEGEIDGVIHARVCLNNLLKRARVYKTLDRVPRYAITLHGTQALQELEKERRALEDWIVT